MGTPFKFIEISNDVPSTEVPSLADLSGVEREVAYCVASGAIDASSAAVLCDFSAAAEVGSQNPTVAASAGTAALFAGVAVAPSKADDGEALVVVTKGLVTVTTHGVTGPAVTVAGGVFADPATDADLVVGRVIDANTIELL